VARHPRLRLHVRPDTPPGDEARGAGAPRARRTHRLQRARPAHEPGRRAGPGRRRLLAPPRARDRRRAGAPGRATSVRRPRRRRHRRALAGRPEPRLRGGRRRRPESRDRPARPRRRALRPRRAARRQRGGERWVHPRGVRGRGRRATLCDPAQRGGRDRRRRPRGRPPRGPRDRTRGRRLRRRRRAVGPADRLLERSGGRMRFSDALANGFGAIAEFKRRSPSAGDLRPGGDVAAVARAYEQAGARAMSVLVDSRFGGSLDDLRAARASASLPLPAKGFFSTREQLAALREAGADAALLILRDLDDATTSALMRDADALGLDTLVEAHDAAELGRAEAVGAPVIGINARDLGTFRIDRRAQLRLLERAPHDRILVAESAIESRAQAAQAELAGAAAVLIGSTLMRAPDPGAKLAELVSRPLVKVCGLTRQEDV